MKKLVIVLIFLLFFLGFTPYKELNSLAVIDTLGVDFIDNKYYLYLNVINENNKTYKVKGNSLGEVFLKAKNIHNKKTYYEHLEVVIFNVDVLNNKTFSFFKDEFTSIDYLVFSTNDKIDSLFNTYHKRNDYKGLINKEKEGDATITGITFKEFLSSNLDDIKDSNIPLISYNKKNLESKGIYVPSKKLILNKNLARANYLLNKKLDSYSTNIVLNDDYYQAILYDLDVNTTYNKDLKISIKGKIDSPDTNNIDNIKKVVKDRLESDIRKLIKKEQDDSFNISNTINYIYLKTRKIDFNIYRKTKLNIDINLKYERKNNYG